MNYRLRIFWAVSTSLLCTISVSPTLHAQTYQAISLGANTNGQAINNTGQVVGYTEIGTATAQPFTWAGGTLTALTLFGGGAGVANGVNDNGEVVGYIVSLAGSTNTFDATLWANGSVTNLGSTLSVPSAAFGINGSAQVIGTSNVGTDPCIPPGPDNPGAGNAFIWSSGVISNLDPTTSEDSVVAAINDAGDAVGYVRSPLVSACAAQAALFSGGARTILAQLPGGDSSTTTRAYSINNAGQIVGSMSTGTTDTAVLWYNGAVTALGTGQALGINSAGQIVGLIPLTNGTAATLWTAAGAEALDLNQLIDPATSVAPWVLIRATAINDSGWIVAIGSVDGGSTVQSFLLQPEKLSLSLTPISLSFSQTVATTSTEQTVTVANTGASAFNVSSIQVSGSFSQTNDCGASVAAGSSCAIEVKFSPTASGTGQGVLTIASGGTSFTINLTGTGTVNSGGGGAIDTLPLVALITMLGLRQRRRFRSRNFDAE